MGLIDMTNGKIYYISFSGTELIARYKESTVTDHMFFSHMHYWNGFEWYFTGGYCVRSGIKEIREASQAEKHNLFRHEVEKGDV